MPYAYPCHCGRSTSSAIPGELLQCCRRTAEELRTRRREAAAAALELDGEGR